jgi:methylated-DNA-[protein]-cysteine S-methyltransferase
VNERKKDMIESIFYLIFHSAFGTFSIVWRKTTEGLKIIRILLSHPQISSGELIRSYFKNSRSDSDSNIDQLGKQIQDFLGGEEVKFDLNLLDWEICSKFQQAVLLAEYAIPRGWVSSYGRIAQHLKIKRAARAVGRALASNPFPIIIPCHRTIRSDGQLGGYQGGLDMKRALLELEGLKVSETGKVLAPRMYY